MPSQCQTPTDKLPSAAILRCYTQLMSVTAVPSLFKPEPPPLPSPRPPYRPPFQSHPDAVKRHSSTKLNESFVFLGSNKEPASLATPLSEAACVFYGVSVCMRSRRLRGSVRAALAVISYTHDCTLLSKCPLVLFSDTCLVCVTCVDCRVGVCMRVCVNKHKLLWER